MDKQVVFPLGAEIRKMVAAEIKRQTADLVEVVRCRDCKFWKTSESINLCKRVKFCTYHIRHQYVKHAEDFCSRGERKDGKDGEQA